MTTYLAPLLVFYFGIALCIAYRGTNPLVLSASAIPMVLLVALRGDSGTDTASYYDAFRGLGSGGGYGGEPLFNAYARLLWHIYPDPRFVVNAISLTIACLLVWAIGRSRYGIWFGGLVLVPGMFYELTMNVMRFGLASTIFLMATRVSPQEKPLRYFGFALVGTCIHFSSAALFLLYPAVTRRSLAVVIVCSTVAFIVGGLLIPGYLESKSSLYGDMSAPNASSGLLFLAVQALMLVIMVRFRRDFDIGPVGWVVCAALGLALYGFTQVTYAGIRFQLILIDLMIVMLWRQYAPATGRMSTRLAGWLFVVGLIALAGRAHNMLDEEGYGQSPFLPYRAASWLEQLS
jgi:hypothetical protein